jgi:hypothetical protein
VYTKLQLEKPKGRENMGDLDIVGRTVLKWISK